MLFRAVLTECAVTTQENDRWLQKGMRIEISEEDLAAFFACLCLGMLHAMRARVIPADVGIWALGPPWAARLKGRVPDGIHDVLYETDEINAMAGLGTPEELDAMLDAMIHRLEAELSNIEEPRWTVHPVTPPGATSL